MELVAREANVAKATLYSYFKNKDELFLAVCARMARLLRGAVEQALMETGCTSRRARGRCRHCQAPADICPGARIAARGRAVFIYAQYAGEIFKDLDAVILDMLRAAMAEDPELSPSAKQLARALYFGSADLANRSASAAEMEAELAHLPPPTWRAPGRSPSSTNRDESRTGHSKSPIQTTSSLLLTN